MSICRITVACTIAALFTTAAGCSASDDDGLDFGASHIARYIQDARTKCEAAGTPNILECSELGREKREARLAALTALDGYETFKGGCYPAAGMTNCEAMIEKALLKTPRQ